MGYFLARLATGAGLAPPTETTIWAHLNISDVRMESAGRRSRLSVHTLRASQTGTWRFGRDWCGPPASPLDLTV